MFAPKRLRRFLGASSTPNYIIEDDPNRIEVFIKDEKRSIVILKKRYTVVSKGRTYNGILTGESTLDTCYLRYDSGFVKRFLWTDIASIYSHNVLLKNGQNFSVNIGQVYTVLHDGKSYSGIISDKSTSTQCHIQDVDGSVSTFAWSDIDSVVAQAQAIGIAVMSRYQSARHNVMHDISSSIYMQ